MQKGNTRERILAAALDLFSVKGYDGTTIDDIAARVGIKGPSIYKYLKGKADLFRALGEKTDEEYNAGMERFLSEAENVHSGKELKEFTMHSVMFTLDSEVITKMRRVLSIEQFRSKDLAEHTTEHHLTKITTLYTKLFKRLMDEGVMIKGDPEIFAMEYTAPTTLLIHMSDRQPEKKQEALTTIERLVDSYIARHCHII
ncbi:TetR/AcrR family transcriptional regulator [Ruminococcus albus]|uniref:TetR/AcrR family transcriptional regulator n=1 Tax=Ruminococcus albus TaxID=1264 RepID=UPI000466A6A8|nr:TetR/AcrR family transcriptional regulator [Ruminococcus albus]